jgi:hypothetical protein
MNLFVATAGVLVSPQRELGGVRLAGWW